MPFKYCFNIFFVYTGNTFPFYKNHKDTVINYKMFIIDKSKQI